MKYTLKGLILGVLLFSSIIWARRFSPDIEDSLRTMHPRMWARWLELHGVQDDYSKPFNRDSLNVRCVGRWSYGPSYEITGKTVSNNTYLFLSRGSGVSILRFVSADSIELLSDINASGLVMQSIVKDTLLYVGCLGVGVEIYNIANLQNPRLINRIITAQNDFFIKDTLLYTISNDTFKIINIANPLSPNTLGAISESGVNVYVSGNYAYIADRWGLYILNVSNPANPTQIASWGTHVVAVFVKDTFCYLTTGNTAGDAFYILNVSNPSAPYELSHINNRYGEDIYVIDYFAYVPGYIIDVSNPSFPTTIYSLVLPGSAKAVWVKSPFTYCFLAYDYEGLHIIDISDPTNPIRDTSILKADYSYKILVRDTLGYLANFFDGIKIINFSQINTPVEIGFYDTIGAYNWNYTVALKDSYAFLEWYHPFSGYLHSINISDPRHPTPVGNTQIIDNIVDIIIRDTFAYIVEGYRFQIYNIANPHQMRLLGDCHLSNGAGCIFLKDSLAYVGSLPSPIININDPSNPVIIGNIPEGPYGIFVKDSFAFFAINYGGLQIWSVANPASPYLIDTIYYQRGYDVIVHDTFAYFGGLDFRILNIANPNNIFEIGRYTTPDRVRKLTYYNNLIYACCTEGGLCIFEQLPSGIEENHNEISITKVLKITPNPTSSRFNLELNRIDDVVLVYNLAGELVKQVNWSKQNRQIDISNLPDGVYFLSSKHSNNKILSKVVKISR
jgi:hypothetical protein